MVVSQAKLIKVNIKHDGNQTKTAKELGISVPAVNKRINSNPHLKKAVLNARELALKQAGLTRPVIYKTIAKHLKAKQYQIVNGVARKTAAPDWTAQKEAYKTALQLHRDLRDDDNETPISSIGSIIFNIMGSSKREVIDVA